MCAGKAPLPSPPPREAPLPSLPSMQHPSPTISSKHHRKPPPATAAAADSAGVTGTRALEAPWQLSEVACASTQSLHQTFDSMHAASCRVGSVSAEPRSNSTTLSYLLLTATLIRKQREQRLRLMQDAAREDIGDGSLSPPSSTNSFHIPSLKSRDYFAASLHLPQVSSSQICDL